MQTLTAGRVPDGPRDARGAEPGRPTIRPVSAAADPEVSLLRVVNIVIRRRGLVALTTVLVVALVAVVTLLSARTYTASAQFMPAARKMPSNLSGLAAQFGVALPGSEPGQSPPFYVDLIGSRGILKQVADSAYEGGGTAGLGPRRAQPLAAWYRIEAPDSILRREAVLTRLRRDVSARASSGTGVVTVKVRAPDPVLAERLARRLLVLLDEFNRQTRKSQAVAEREFTGRRLEDARIDLRLAENRLQRFLETNRSYVDAPSLRLDEERIRRDLGVRQQIVSSLTQSY